MFAMFWVYAIFVILEHCGWRVLEYIDGDANDVDGCTHDACRLSDCTQV